MSSVSPMGNQDKFYDTDTGNWYKADYLGYEGLSEYIVSELLKRSKIKNQHFHFIQYDMCCFRIGNKQVTGCCCKNFVKDCEAELTLYRLFKVYFNIDITVQTVGMSVAEQIQYVVDSVEAVTGLSIIYKEKSAPAELVRFLGDRKLHKCLDKVINDNANQHANDTSDCDFNF